MDVYAQLQQRVKREHGKAFDRLVRDAREKLYGTELTVPEAPIGTPIGTRPANNPLKATTLEEWSHST